MLEYFHKNSIFLLVVLTVFVGVSVIEMLANRETKQATIKDRLLNVGAGAVFLIAGGHLAALLFSEVMQLHLFKVSTLNPIAYMVLFVLVVVAPIIFLGLHPTGLLYATYFGLFFLYFGHSRLNLDLGPLSHVFVGPRFHRVHLQLHSSDLNCNFAQYFPFLDRIFGTHSEPRPISEVETGVDGCASMREQWAPIIWPIPLWKGSAVN